ncbi:MAG: ParB N-terminal domain-containing protein [Desulfohalobiaceae bacterium]
MQAENPHSQPGLHSLEPGQVDCSGPWLFWAREPGQALLQSLRELGQLEPILVRAGRLSWELVSGYKRLRAVQQLGRQVLAREVQGQEVDLGLIRLQAALGSALTPQALLAACRFFQARVAEERLLGLLERWVRPLLSRRQWPLLLAWLELTLDYDRILQEERLPLEAGSRLQKLDPAALQHLKPLFQNLSWSVNQARSLLDWLLEAADMERKPVAQLLSELKISEILAQDLSPRDSKDRILARIKARRFPWLQSLEQEFALLCKQLQGRHWRVQPEQNFETDALYLQARVDSAGQLPAAVRELQEILDSQAWSRLQRWQTERFYPE